MSEEKPALFSDADRVECLRRIPSGEDGISYDVWIDDITNSLLVFAYREGQLGRGEVRIPVIDWASKSPEDRTPMIDASFAHARLNLLEEAA